MKKELRNKVLEKVGDELNCKGFLLVDSSSKWMIFHRKSDSYIEIVQIAQDKYETFFSVSVSIAFFDVPSEITNINYVFFNEFNDGDFKKISTDDCREKFYLKGNFGEVSITAMFIWHWGEELLA